MEQINIQKSEVFLSTYDNSDWLLPVSEKHKNLKNICVAVKFGDIIIKISPKDTCKCTWNEADKSHADKLTHPAYWQMVGSVYYEVNQAIEMLGQEPINWVWTSVQYSGYGAWAYRGTHGNVYALYKSISNSVRATKVFKINESQIKSKQNGKSNY